MWSRSDSNHHLCGDVKSLKMLAPEKKLIPSFPLRLMFRCPFYTKNYGSVRICVKEVLALSPSLPGGGEKNPAPPVCC